MVTIREGYEEEVQHFQLWNDDNDGETLLVAVLNGEIVGFALHTGPEIYFVESNVKGAGRALVEYIIADVGGDWFQARNVSRQSVGFWEKMGFVQGTATGERFDEFHYELEAV